jgi:hypothetical protein
MNSAASGKVQVLGLSQRVDVFVKLGELFGHFGANRPWPGHACGLSEGEYAAFNDVVLRAVSRNGWFTEANVRQALDGLSIMLRREALDAWVKAYPALQGQRVQRIIGIIMAGNVPLVGFHDLLSVLICGHIARVKCSSDDAGLTPAVIQLIGHLSPDMASAVIIAPDKLGEVDAVIATGSDNTARYFDHYFAQHPRIVRRSRTSVAVLDGTETDEELSALGEDIFRYFGLGCRNVGKLYVPQDFDLDRIFKAIFPWEHLARHNKWANNYDYHKAIWLMDRVPLIENGFVLFKEDNALYSPLGSLFYERYNDRAAVLSTLKAEEHRIQCIIGHGHLPFGTAQCPGPLDYADGVDTMQFLLELA